MTAAACDPKECAKCGRGRHVRYGEPLIIAGKESWWWIWVCCKDPKHNAPPDEELRATRADPRQQSFAF
jgi:hypothetical protein